MIADLRWRENFAGEFATPSTRSSRDRPSPTFPSPAGAAAGSVQASAALPGRKGIKHLARLIFHPLLLATGVCLILLSDINSSYQLKMVWAPVPGHSNACTKKKKKKKSDKTDVSTWNHDSLIQLSEINETSNDQQKSF